MIPIFYVASLPNKRVSHTKTSNNHYKRLVNKHILDSFLLSVKNLSWEKNFFKQNKIYIKIKKGRLAVAPVTTVNAYNRIII